MNRHFEFAMLAALAASLLLLTGGCSVLPPQAEAPSLHVIDALPAAVKAPSRRA